MRIVTAKLANSFPMGEASIQISNQGSGFSVTIDPDWTGLRIVAGHTFNQTIEWWVFEVVCDFLYARPNYFAQRGSLINGPLGVAVPFQTIDGFVADRCYGRNLGENETMRVSFIAGILIHLGICHEASHDVPEPDGQVKKRKGVALTDDWVEKMRNTPTRRHLGAGL